MRLHIWRLGLTALILKNCHLFPDDLLSLFSSLPPSESSSCSSLSNSFNPYTHHLRHPSRTTTRRNYVALHRLEATFLFPRTFLFLSNRCWYIYRWRTTPLVRRISALVNMGDTHVGFSPFAGRLYAQVTGLGITKWQEYVVGISGKIVWGWATVDEGRHRGKYDHDSIEFPPEVSFICVALFRL